MVMEKEYEVITKLFVLLIFKMHPSFQSILYLILCEMEELLVWKSTVVGHPESLEQELSPVFIHRL